MMIALGIDTAEAIGGVAMVSFSVDEEEFCDELLFDAPMSHAARLPAAIEQLLARREVKITDIEAVCINQGPGSFTGLRIGIAFAQGLCQSLDIPLVGVRGIDSYRARTNAVNLGVLIQDRRDILYVAWFRGGNQRGELEAMNITEVINRAKQEGEMTFIGSGADLFRQRLETVPGVIVVDKRFNSPSPVQIVRLAAAMDFKPNLLYTIEPFYVTKPLAKMQLQ
ncbi:tRNA (adenosine(37)-N6)-threonylcarbamoyltransferase complex dimerization subunit type 1 TsaB [Candidatus Acetothermia bacterium]|jgi:tRNA threonylcarbamoyladenosine biosynthesis protein TsaB|nr:tRNA (adenosine(37)-N6)-threonylcarbamoyltransferase complex dimerization subunit type 1 TsaB [Candidatus Acetothermia bacterium]MCI2427547.1 tRNA (adenosine(37)-N6)-threonylcarbamoyltransferase complex dimerization subunit type 1 TsaB [Candidatus Acetothermia bacterium]